MASGGRTLASGDAALCLSCFSPGPGLGLGDRMWNTGCQGSGSRRGALCMGKLRPGEGSMMTLPFLGPGSSPLSESLPRGALDLQLVLRGRAGGLR